MAKAGKHLDLPSLCLFQFPRWVDPNPKSEKTKTTSQNHLHHSTQNKRRILPNKLDNNLCKSSGDHGTFIEEWSLRCGGAPMSMEESQWALSSANQVWEGEGRPSGDILFYFFPFFVFTVLRPYPNCVQNIKFFFSFLPKCNGHGCRSFRVCARVFQWPFGFNILINVLSKLVVPISQSFVTANTLSYKAILQEA